MFTTHYGFTVLFSEESLGIDLILTNDFLILICNMDNQRTLHPLTDYSLSPLAIIPITVSTSLFCAVSAAMGGILTRCSATDVLHRSAELSSTGNGHLIRLALPYQKTCSSAGEGFSALIVTITYICFNNAQ